MLNSIFTTLEEEKYQKKSKYQNTPTKPPFKNKQIRFAYIFFQFNHQKLNNIIYMDMDQTFRTTSMRTNPIPTLYSLGKSMINYHFDNCFSIRLKNSDKDI